MRNICALCLALAFSAAPAMGRERAGQAQPRHDRAACAGESVPGRLRGLTAQGDLVLEGGATARLAGVRLPAEGPHRDEALAWLRAQAGREVLIQAEPGRDRWNRMQARIRLADEANPLDLTQGLIEPGLGMVDPGAMDTVCGPEWLSLEETARARGLGLWRDDRYKPLDVESGAGLPDRIGDFALVEGRIRSVGERAQRTYLNFGGHWAEDFTIIVPKKTWKLMTDRGVTAATLKGQRIRARGILESWQGASLTVVVPEMIERLPGDRLPR